MNSTDIVSATNPSNAGHKQRQIHIFCDGGFANRVNSLASGLAIAHELGPEPVVHWPQNNWCRAGFGDIFTNDFDVRVQELSALSGQASCMLPMLHDTIASNLLDIAFQSAYRHDSLKALGDELDQHPDRDVLYYPALIPNWLTRSQIQAQLAKLNYRAEIVGPVRDFIDRTIGGPFHSIHLRRTDLTVGLSDEEVRWLLQHHPEQRFYICSDDAETEATLQRFANAYIRTKSAYVHKMSADEGWNVVSRDSAGRLYGSNIDRSSAAVIEGVIDLLVLSQGSVVGNSGSTFQSLGRLYGRRVEWSDFDFPQPIPFIEMRSVIRRMESGAMSASELRSVCDLLQRQNRVDEQIQVLRQALDRFRGGDLFVICYNLAHALIGKKALREASIFLTAALQIAPDMPQAVELHAQLSNALASARLE